MKKVDLVLGPGGYWVVSGLPINWKTKYKTVKRPVEDLQDEKRRKIAEVAKRLCWKKEKEKKSLRKVKPLHGKRRQIQILVAHHKKIKQDPLLHK